MEPTNIPVGFSRETKIRRSADGKWFQDDEPVTNVKLQRAFDRWLTRAEDGRFCLKNDVNWAYVTIEGAPYFVRAVQIDDAGVRLMLSNDELVPLDFGSLREGPDDVLYCDAYPDMAARFDSHAAMQLEEVLDEDEAGPYLRNGRERVRPPRVADPLSAPPRA